MIIEFLPSIAVLYKTPAFSPDSMVIPPVGHQHRSLPLSVRLLQKGPQALSIETFLFGKPAKVDEGGIDIDQADWAWTEVALCHSCRR